MIDIQVSYYTWAFMCFASGWLLTQIIFYIGEKLVDIRTKYMV